MIEYPPMYYCLFQAITDAIEALESLNIGVCKQILIHPQQEVEEIYISAEDE